MKKGCFIGLLTWAACAGAYWYYLHTRFLPPLDWAVPVVAGLLMAVVIGNLRAGLASAFGAARVSEEATFGGVMGEKPRDGQIVTAPGRIRASGSPLHAPLSDRPAVLYSYDIGREWRDANGVRAAKDFAGFGLTPSVIDSHFGPLRLLGFPTLEGFDKASVENPDLAKIREYIATTSFLDMAGFNPLTIYREIKELMADDDGQLRKDWRMSDSVEVTEDQDLSEQIVVPGEQVTAIGRYSAEKGGLVQDLGGGNPLRLIRGDARMSSGALWTQAAGRIIGSLIFAAVVNGLLFGFLNMQGGKPIAIPKSQRQTRQDIEALHDASRHADIPGMERLLAKGTPVDGRDGEQATPLIRAGNARTAAWLLAHGAEVNAVNYKGQTALMEQGSNGNAEVVKVLIKSGANLDIVSTQWKTTALQQALDAERLDVVQILRDAGAHDVTVTEKNGHAVGKDSEPVRTALSYLDAIQHQDLAAMNALSTRGPFKDVDFKAWKESRPLNPRLVSGFANEKAATIALRGKRTDGMYETWTFQLVRPENGGWKISDERWETRLDGKGR